jgi:hypothetical protein
MEVLASFLFPFVLDPTRDRRQLTVDPQGKQETNGIRRQCSREQRAESREQRAESREQRAESREQRAESREQRAESREQRADLARVWKKVDAFTSSGREWGPRGPANPCVS